ncbi:MAG TPA: DUF2127 domain-containing protein [Candidatus Paceibacterota bacterium]|nr:DUF2127 domain-containing protein [Candidatus Paceibacterota bacterium]
MKLISEKTYHVLFDIGIVLKAIITALEMIFGVLFYILTTAQLNGMLAFVIGGEINEQPRDFLWNYFIQGFQRFIGPEQYFWAFILISHGIVKIAALVAIYYKKLWAYPFAAAIFAALAAYQIYSYFFIPSLLLLLVTIFDFVLIGLILHEWKHKRRIARAVAA